MHNLIFNIFCSFSVIKKLQTKKLWNVELFHQFRKRSPGRISTICKHQLYRRGSCDNSFCISWGSQQKLKKNMCSNFNILTVINGEAIWDSRLLSVKKMLMFGGEKFIFFVVELYYMYFLKDQSLMFQENYESPLRKWPHSEKTWFISPLKINDYTLYQRGR